ERRIADAVNAIESRIHAATASLAHDEIPPIDDTKAEAFDMGDAVEAVLASIHGPWMTSFDRVVPLRIVASRKELQLVVFCLLENAADAVAPRRGGLIDVRLRRFRRGGVLEVRDDGPGLKPGDDERAFARFFTTKSNRLGLGLPIARSLARCLGGGL